jgi:hypothetical protein
LQLLPIIHIGRPFFFTNFSQQEITCPAVLPWQLNIFDASALLPKESMLKSIAAPNTAPALILWILLNFVICLLLGFAIVFDRCPKYGEIVLIRA